MHYAGLHQRIRKHGFDGFGEAFQPVRADDEHVLYAAILEIREHGQPVLGALVAVRPQAQQRLLALQVDADLSSPQKEYERLYFPCTQILNSDAWEQGLIV